ncbi:MAG: hypothetical protein N3E51_03245 [Candidatus Micrarchaeota archaeon]|nr:hypothetical protein [Candidatus Micrarchaeota archaeon]
MRRGMAVGLLFICLLLLAGCTSSTGKEIKPVMGWLGMPLLAMAIVSLLLALGWMAFSFLGDESMKAWVKKEVGQLFYSALIMLVVLVLMASMDGWLRVLATAGSPAWRSYVNSIICCDPAVSTCLPRTAIQAGKPCHIALAMDYLQMLYESGRTNAITALTFNSLYALADNISIGLSAKAIVELAGISIRPLAGLSIISEYYNVIFDLTVKMMMFARIQQLMLEYLHVAFLPLMLSMGLVLRIFYFTRKLGGLLIALGLCAYIVLPMFYALGNAILFGFVRGSDQNSSPKFGTDVDMENSFIPGIAGDLNPNTMSQNEMSKTKVSIMDICGSASQENIEAQKRTMNKLESQLLQMIKTNWLKGNILPKFSPDGTLGSLGALMVFSIVIPFLGLMAMLAAFKYLSPLIGGDVEISILSRLI